MRVERIAAVLSLLLLGTSLDASERNRRICIANEDRSGWICGTEDDPPQAPAAPVRRDAPPAPPPFLANPQAPRGLPIAPEARTGPRGSAEVEVQPIPASEPVIESLPEPEAVPAPAAAEDAPRPSPEPPAPVSEPSSEPGPQPVIPADVPAPTVEPEPVSIPESAAVDAPQISPPETTAPGEQAPAPQPLPSEPRAPETVQTEPVSTPSRPADTPLPDREATPAPRAGLIPPGPWRVDAMLRAGTDQWTLQLAHGSDVHALARLAEQLALPAEQLYLLPLERDRARWWLLAWGQFDTPDAARDAVAGLKPAEGLRGVWPRRIAPLQNEIERARRTLGTE